MNIISGRFKGYKIDTSLNTTYRPTKSSVRKSLFDKLKSLQNKTVLDLFAGTGSLGIEALSRNCSKVVFVELNKKNYSVLSKNVIDLNLKNKSKIYFKDAFEWVKKNDLSMYDLIFIDPPFDEGLELKVLKSLTHKNELKSSCKFYLEYSKFNEIEIPDNFLIIKERLVGDVKAVLLEKK